MIQLYCYFLDFFVFGRLFFLHSLFLFWFSILDFFIFASADFWDCFVFSLC